jgi:hypothetical protein
MADLKLVRLTKGDTQEDFINKLNQNFGRILSAGGGTFGAPGESGPIGEKGATGPTGDYGPPGDRGSQWFVSNSEPPSDVQTYLIGDHWVVATEDYLDYILTDTGWQKTGINLTGTQFFKKILDIKDRNGNTLKDAIVEFTSTPISTTFVISDSLVSSLFGNNQYAKFQISTLGQFDKHILEFSKSELQDGSAMDAYKHPYFAWGDLVNPNDYSLIWGMTGGGFTLSASKLFLGSQTSDVSMGATGAISLNSSSSFFLTTGGDLEISTGGDLTLNSDSLSLGATAFSLSGSLKISSSSTSVAGLTADANSDSNGNLRVVYDSPSILGVSDSSVNLFRAENQNSPIPALIVSGNGDFQPANLSQAYSQDAAVLSGSLGPYGTSYIDWSSVSSSLIGSPGDNTLSPFNSIIITPGTTGGSGTIGSPLNGVSFLGAYGAAISGNPLAKIISEGRSFSLTVLAPTTNYFFQAVGIGTYSTPGDPFPNPAVSSEWEILPFPSQSVTFHVLRESDIGLTGSWKVFYEANKSSGILYE